MAIFSLVSLNAIAGEVTINQSKTLINNQVFEHKNKRIRNKQREEQRVLENLQWIYSLPSVCLLYQKQYLIYRCGKALFYKGYAFNGFIKYKPLTKTETLKLQPH
ncbi:hypothetical protein [uncultured Psychromonas sp.]|uniref:hypothetical protein n=1 Tax=uncultured Psychromonas sp. TaxID=173974 RepID=UPI00262D0C1E|nr:hypothetical protein [uncultured Psychromonas sp.]